MKITNTQAEEKFLESIKMWKSNHEDEYYLWLEKLLNSKRGYFEIYKFVGLVVPFYTKRIRRVIFDRGSIDLDKFFSEKEKFRFGQLFFNIFMNDSSNVKTPSILYFMHFDNGFELLVEKMEDLKSDPNADLFHKGLASNIVWFIKNYSVKHGNRTIEDWRKHEKYLELVISDKPLVLQADYTSQQHDERKWSFDFDEGLEAKIVKFASNNNNKTDLSYLIIAIEELKNISFNNKIKNFRDMLNDLTRENSLKIIGERGIQDAYKNLNHKDSKDEFIKNNKSHREKIEKVKNFLSE